MEKYDLVVIGSGPAGEKAAVKAAYFGKRVALVEKESRFGGAGVVSGTLPSKTLKETSLYLSGKYDKGLYGIDRNLEAEASCEHFMFRKNYIIKTESAEVRQNLVNHGVTLYQGIASFENPHQIHISGRKEVSIEADYILIATGSYPFHPPYIPFDKKRVHDSDTILDIQRFPHSIAILGAGVIGLEYATIFSTMGVKVFLINRSDRLLSFIDQEIVQHLIYHMKRDQIDLLFNKSLFRIDIPPDPLSPVDVILESKEVLHVDMFLYAAGRNGATRPLNLKAVGIEVDNRENIPVNEKYQTCVPHIFAAGDVVGFPALASTSMDQGRVAVTHMFHTQDIEKIASTLPYGIYTIPEISAAGLTEEEAKEKQIDYGVGIARHERMPRGKIMGAREGLLKLIFDKKTQVVLGVHIIGHLATELIHHGLELIESKRTLLEMIGKVYNFPTLHDLYKYAAFDGLSNLKGRKFKT